MKAQALVPLSVSALGGLCLGLVLQAGAGKGERPLPVAQREPALESGALNVGNELSSAVILPGLAEGERFSHLPPERQKEILWRWASQRADLRTCSDELTQLKAIQELTYEQASALLETAADHSVEFIQTALKDRLAALDPARALELGRQRGDSQLRSAAVVTMFQKNAAEGLRAVAQLSEKEREGVWVTATNLVKAGGSLHELESLLKELPQMTKDNNFNLGMSGALGWLAAHQMTLDPAGGLSEMRQICRIMAEIQVAQARGDTGKGQLQQLLPMSFMEMLSELRAQSPTAARDVFDALSEGEKSDFLVRMEGGARLKELGADAAIRFAEAQSKEGFVKEAAQGIWGALAQQDRSSALQWIESLPPGVFREGVLASVLSEASLRARNGLNAQEAIFAGAELLSKKTQLDYYSMWVSRNRVAPSELIASLPLSEADKQELRRRAAPIKVK